MKFKPAPGWLQVEPDMEKHTRLLTPEKDRSRPSAYSNKSKVIAVGEGRMMDNGKIKPMPCKVGDVIFHQVMQDNIIEYPPLSKQYYIFLEMEQVVSIVEE